MTNVVFDHMSTVCTGAASGVSAVSDVVMAQAANGATIIYGVVRSAGNDGLVTVMVWQVGSNGALTLLDSAVANAGAVAGIDASLTLVPAAQAGGAQDILLITGVNGTPIWSQSIATNGTLNNHTVTLSGVLPEDINQTTAVTVNGTTFIYGARLGNERPAIYEVETNGSWSVVSGASHPDSGNGIEANIVTAFGVLDEDFTGGRPILITALEGDSVLVSYHVGTKGYLSEYDRIDVADGIGISNPTVMEVVTIGGRAYAVVGAAGSGTVTVVAVANDGTLTVTDHVMDDLNTRFAGISVMQTLVVGDVA